MSEHARVPVTVELDQVVDRPDRWETVESITRFRGHVIGARTDRVRMPDGAGGFEIVERDVVAHPGSVAVLAIDDEDRVLLQRQYRHPAGHQLWEIPAGLRDVAGEPLADTAARELAEEASYRAARWSVLVDAFTSPGMSNERTRIFLARELTPVPDEENHFERVHEEADMPIAWIPLDEAVARVLDGELHSPLAVMGILAAHAARGTSGRGEERLRPTTALEG